jgi:molybdate transport system ATP-binding protein
LADRFPGNLDDALLSLNLQHRAGSLSLNATFTLTHDWTTLFGPSGSGKSTILRAIAGLLRPASATITFEGRTLVDTSHHIFLPPHLRPVRGASQTAFLFPRRTVQQNLEYGLGWHSHPADRNEVLTDLLELFRLRSLADRDTRTLSGGERQRVSVARAVAAAATFDGPSDTPSHALLLLDEPFTGLDTALRDTLAIDLRDWLRRAKITTLSVSHDVAECFLLASDVIRIAEGQIVEQGPVEQVLKGERERILIELNA